MNDSHYVPRSVLLDLEPRVIDSIRNGPFGKVHNQENVFVCSNGSGAGNNWAHGYAQGSRLDEEIMEIIDREAEGTDNLEGYMLCHSIAGGTGSGMGSYILETVERQISKEIDFYLFSFPKQ